MNKCAAEKKFILKFIQSYQCLPALWNTNLEAYNNRQEKKKQYKILLEVYKEQFPDATLEDMKKKINVLRSNYHREKMRIANCNNADAAEPTLFYFNALNNFLEYMKKSSTPRTSKDAKKEDTANRRKRKQDASDALIEIATKRFASEKKKNPTEIITDSWAVRLDRMESTQRILCEKFIEDILFEGQMGTLHRNSVHLNVNDVRTPLHLSIPPVYESSQESTPRHQSSCSTPIYQDVVTKEESISPNSSIQEQQSSCSTVVLDEVVTKEESISPTSSMSKYFSTFHQ